MITRHHQDQVAPVCYDLINVRLNQGESGRGKSKKPTTVLPMCVCGSNRRTKAQQVSKHK